jgi:hypothetical protein
MAHHLEEIAAIVTPGAHAVLLLDQAGWHTTRKLPLPDNITLLPLPARSPELNPVENLRQFMRDTGSATETSTPMPTSLTVVATPRIRSSSIPGASRRLDRANLPINPE